MFEKTITQPGSVPRVALSVAEAAVAAGLSRSFIYGRISDGSLKTSKLGRRRLVRPEDLAALIERAA